MGPLFFTKCWELRPVILLYIVISWDDIPRIVHRDGYTRRFLLFFNRFEEATRFLENAKHIFDVA